MSARLELKSWHRIGLQTQLEKYVRSSIHSISNKPYTRNYARMFFIVNIYIFCLNFHSYSLHIGVIGVIKLSCSLFCCRKNRTSRCGTDCGCEQKYKWHRLLAYDPDDNCKGIFMDWFLFPSCCVCRCDPNWESTFIRASFLLQLSFVVLLTFFFHQSKLYVWFLYLFYYCINRYILHENKVRRMAVIPRLFFYH